MNPVRSFSRPLLASIFVYSGIDVLRNPEPRAKAAGPMLDKLSETLPLERVQMVQLNAGVQLAAGSMMALGRLPRLSALVLAGSVVPTTIGGHRFWEEEEPQRAMQQRTHFLKNAAILGGLLMAAMQPKNKRGRRRGQRRAAKAS
ncbi:MAG: DoxX family protein [Acidimicrobiales bacterium]